jgi:hypothetical protein
MSMSRIIREAAGRFEVEAKEDPELVAFRAWQTKLAEAEDDVLADLAEIGRQRGWAKDGDIVPPGSNSMTAIIRREAGR